METPSRILRRIEALEAQDSDLPSLPSFPEFEGSDVESFHASSAQSVSPKTMRIEDDDDAVPYQSTPAPLSSQMTRSTVRPPSSSSSATRFANSMRISLGTTRRSQQDSFEVSEILPTQIGSDSSASASIPDVYLQPGENADAMLHLQALGAMAVTARSNNDLRFPHSYVSDEHKGTPSPKTHDYSVSLRSEPKVHISYM